MDPREYERLADKCLEDIASWLEDFDPDEVDFGDFGWRRDDRVSRWDALRPQSTSRRTPDVVRRRRPRLALQLEQRRS